MCFLIRSDGFDAKVLALILLAEYHFTTSYLQAPDSFAGTWMENSPHQALASELPKKERIL